jgi:hypothetical protein
MATGRRVLLHALLLATLELKLEAFIFALERWYRPDQPRAPRGTPIGGQWIDDGGGRRSERIRTALSAVLVSDRRIGLGDGVLIRHCLTKTCLGGNSPRSLLPPSFVADNSGATLPGIILAMQVVKLMVTASADSALRRAFADFEPKQGTGLALVYTSTFTNSDGTTVRGFRPGYLPSPWPASYLGSAWIRAKIVDAGEFYLMPNFRWRVENQYLLDADWPVFSIAQAPAGDAAGIDAVLL